MTGRRTVWIVQHAEKAGGPGDPPLTSRGREQAEQVAAALSEAPARRLLTSPLTRARQTAEPVARVLGVTAEVDERLRERMNWDGSVPLEQFLVEWDRATADRSFVPTAGQSSAAAGASFAAAVTELLHGEEDAIVVSHGGATTDGLRTLVGDERLTAQLPDWRSGVPPAGITTVHRTGGDVQIEAVGSTSHLDVPVLTVSCWLARRGDAVLAVRPTGQDVWYLPGGLSEPDEDERAAVVREVHEEVAVRLDAATVTERSRVSGWAHGRTGVWATLVLFDGDGVGEPVARPPEIDAATWLRPAEWDRFAPLAEQAVRGGFA